MYTIVYEYLTKIVFSEWGLAMDKQSLAAVTLTLQVAAHRMLSSAASARALGGFATWHTCCPGVESLRVHRRMNNSDKWILVFSIWGTSIAIGGRDEYRIKSLLVLYHPHDISILPLNHRFPMESSSCWIQAIAGGAAAPSRAQGWRALLGLRRGCATWGAGVRNG
jgi:hypothetical protein